MPVEVFRPQESPPSAAAPEPGLPPRASTRPVRVAVICDFAEERWPSMDLVGDMLLSHLRAGHSDRFAAERVQPRLPFATQEIPGRFTRLLGRFLFYPRELQHIVDDCDLFHIVDHSYAHLVHSLPADRTIVTCHDLDTFRCLLTPQAEPRSFPFRTMARRILTGLRKAAHVTCDTAVTRDEILAYSLVAADRLTIVHNGVHPALKPDPDPAADCELGRMLERSPRSCPELLHVGSTIPRKRIDVLLRVFAELLHHHPKARLIRVGGPFIADQELLAQYLGIRGSIDVLPYLTPELLAAAYRRSSVLLQTSDSEGFGLPVIEALACGAPVIASDIAPLREVGGAAVTFCPVADIGAWTAAVLQQLTTPPSRAALLAQAGRFNWSSYAASMTGIYRKVLARGPEEK